MDSHGIQYLELRAQQERDAAEHSENPKVRAIHLELAQRYSEALRSAQSQVPIGAAGDQSAGMSDRAPFKALN